MKPSSGLGLPALGLAALLVLLAAYWPALSSGYVWDDDQHVWANRLLRTPSGLARIWTDPKATPQYYPLVHTAFWLEYRLWGARPFGYHFVNVLLHAANAFLLWRLLTALAVPGALLAAAVFAFHPIQVESVAWITELKNLLSGLFYLAALGAYLRFAGIVGAGGGKEGRALHRWKFYGAALTLFVLALLAKTVTATLPVAVLTVLWWRRGRVGTREAVPLVPFFAIGAAFGFLTVWLERTNVGAAGAEWSYTLVERGLIAGRVLWFYLGKLALPLQQVFVYPRWTIDAASWGQYFYPLAFAALLAALFAARGRVGRAPAAAALFYAATLGPALGFVNVYPMRFSFVADHFQYLAGIGPIVLGTALATRAWARWGRNSRVPGAVLALALLAPLCWLTWRQTGAYRDDETLWRDTLRKNPEAWIAHNNLGNILRDRGEFREAEEHLRECVRIKPNNLNALSNLGLLLADQKRYSEALIYLHAVVQQSPAFAEALNNLGVTYEKSGQKELAIDYLLRAIAAKPTYAAPAGSLGRIFLSLNRPSEALRYYRQAAALEPESAAARNNVASALIKLGEYQEAGREVALALALDPNHVGARFNRELLRKFESVDAK